MRQFVYTVYLPGQKKTVQIKELQFSRYKHLVKSITNDNDNVIIDFFDSLLADLCSVDNDVKTYSFLDKLIILLTIRLVCISPELELTGTCPETKNNFNFTVKLTDIIDKLQTLQLLDEVYGTTKTFNNGDLVIELGMPSILQMSTVELGMLNTVFKKIILNGTDVTKTREQIIDHLPAVVLRDIKNYLTTFNEYMSGIKLLDIRSPFASNKTVEMPLNLFSNSIIDFLKICFRRNLLSLYELEYFLINRLNLSYELIREVTPAELNIYINLFKEEKREEEKARKSSKTLNPLQP